MRQELLHLLEWIRQQGDQAILMFIIVDTIWIVIGMPASILSLGAAILFGFWRGLFAVLIAADIAAVISFFVVRYLARDWLVKRIQAWPKFARVDRAVGKSGWPIIMLFRLSPVFPFGILNYALGLTGVSFRNYAIGTLIGVIPGTAVYIYLGTLIRDLANLSGPRAERSPVEWAFYIVGFLATIAVCYYIVRQAKAALAEDDLEQANGGARGDEVG